jgi:pSer/pThr/pTyr-binding forkhead associated (FHA) protein
LRLEAEDTLGLVGSSMETQVQINVVRPRPSPLVAITRSAPALVGAGIVIVGALVFLLLIISGRIQPYSHRVARMGRKPEVEAAGAKSEPAPARLPNWVNRLSWPQRRLASRPDALFIPVGDSSGAPLSGPMTVSAAEITIGSDSSQATLVVDDPSVSSLHARLVRSPEGAFQIFDEGSIAGVWINYSPVTPAGAYLEHGDIVHIGRAGFRFTQRQPTRIRKPTVTYLEPAGTTATAVSGSGASTFDATESSPEDANNGVEPVGAEEGRA